MRPTRLGVAWTAAALLGMVVTAALTWSVSRLAGQRIGLSSAPPSAISGLAPVRPARHIAGAPPAPAPATSAPVAPATPAVGRTSAAPAPAAPAPPAVSAPPVSAAAAAPSRSSGSEDGGDGHGANARSGGGRDD